MKTVDDPLSSDQKRRLYKDSVLAVSTFDPPMSGWLDTAYSGVPADYSRDVAPAHHYVPVVILDDASNPRDWSWELSVDINAGVKEFPSLRSLYMNEYVFDQYERWVMANAAISTSDALDHLDLLYSVAVKTPQPYADAKLACEQIWLAAVASGGGTR